VNSLEKYFEMKRQFQLQLCQCYRRSLGIRLLLIISLVLLSQRVQSIFVHRNSFPTLNTRTAVSGPGPSIVPAPMSVSGRVSKLSVVGRTGPVTSPEINDTTVVPSSSGTLLVLRLAQCRANCLKKVSEVMDLKNAMVYLYNFCIYLISTCSVKRKAKVKFYCSLQMEP